MRIPVILTLAAAALTLAGCSKDSPQEEAPVENNAVEAPVEIAPVNNAAPPANITNEAAPVAPPPEFSDDEQMRDDADATGLTARLPQDGGEQPGSSGNETRPAE